MAHDSATAPRIDHPAKPAPAVVVRVLGASSGLSVGAVPTAIFIKTARTGLLLDCGPKVPERLVELGIANEVTHIVCTHDGITSYGGLAELEELYRDRYHRSPYLLISDYLLEVARKQTHAAVTAFKLAGPERDITLNNREVKLDFIPLVYRRGIAYALGIATREGSIYYCTHCAPVRKQTRSVDLARYDLLFQSVDAEAEESRIGMTFPEFSAQFEGVAEKTFMTGLTYRVTFTASDYAPFKLATDNLVINF